MPQRDSSGESLTSGQREGGDHWRPEWDFILHISDFLWRRRFIFPPEDLVYCKRHKEPLFSSLHCCVLFDIGFWPAGVRGYYSRYLKYSNKKSYLLGIRRFKCDNPTPPPFEETKFFQEIPYGNPWKWAWDGISRVCSFLTISWRAWARSGRINAFNWGNTTLWKITYIIAMLGMS